MGSKVMWWAAAALLMLAMGGGAMYLATTADSRRNEEKYRGAIARAEAAHGIPGGLLHRLLYQESRFRSDIISGATRSRVGALGMAQFMPETARAMGIDPLIPQQAIDGAARYLAQNYQQFRAWPLAVAAYNAGPGNVAKYQGVPPFAETRAYVRAIVGTT